MGSGAKFQASDGRSRTHPPCPSFDTRSRGPGRRLTALQHSNTRTGPTPRLPVRAGSQVISHLGAIRFSRLPTNSSPSVFPGKPRQRLPGSSHLDSRPKATRGSDQMLSATDGRVNSTRPAAVALSFRSLAKSALHGATNG